MAETAKDMEQQQEETERKSRLSITFGKGLAKPFTSKEGVEMQRISIPNPDPEDKRSWETFVLPASMVHENESGKSLWASLPQDGSTRLTRSVETGKDENGQRTWGEESRTVMNTELKSLVEAYRDKEIPRVTIKCGKGLAAPFTSKDGKEMTRISIPNPDPDDKRSWETFVLPSSMVHENESGKSVWASLPENGETRLSRSVVTGQDENGKNTYERQERTVPNTELKSLVEAYRGKSQEEDRLFADQEKPAGPEHAESIAVVMVKAGKYAEISEVQNDLESLQEAVGGDIEVVSPFNEKVAVICNEEGKIQEQEMNRALRDINGDVIDVLCGDFLIAAVTEDGGFGSLSPDQQKQFEDMFYYPEAFAKTEKGIEAYRQVPENVLNDAVKSERASEGPDL